MRRSAACLLLWSGCSFLFVRAPPESAPPTEEVRCTESKLAVAADIAATAMSVLFAIDAIVASRQSSCTVWWCVDKGASGPLGAGAILIAIGFGASAGVGDARVDRCRGHNDTARQARSQDVLR